MLLILNYHDVKKKALPGYAVNQNERQQDRGNKWEDRDSQLIKL